MPWLLKICPSAIVGGLTGRGPQDLLLPIALEIEAAIHKLTEPILGLDPDKRKCFDLLLPPFISQLLIDLSMDTKFPTAINDFYTNFTRAFKINKWVGQWWKATCGMAQGCSASIIGINALMSVWSDTCN